MENIGFGRYVPKKSQIHLLSPVIKVILLAAMIFTVFYVDTILALLLLLCLEMAVAFYTKIGFKHYINANKFVAMLSVFIALSFFLIGYYNSSVRLSAELFWENFDKSFTIFLRLILLALLNSIFLFTTSANEISRSVEFILYPLKFLGLNIRKISLMVSMSIKFLPIISQEIEKIMISQKSRGINFSEKNIPKKIKNYSKIITPLIRNILKKSEVLACSMISRGYSFEGNRTQFKKITIKKYDIISLLLFLTIVFGVILCNNIAAKNAGSFYEILH